MRGHVTLLTLFSAAWLGLATSGLAAAWTDSRTAGPLICRADFPLAGVEGLLKDLGQIQADLTHALGIPPGRESVELYLFHDQEVYARYLGRYLPGVHYRRALYVKGHGPGRVFAYWSPEIKADLRHECTHALLHASLPEVPLWLDEGLAKYFEVPATRRAYDHPYLAVVRSHAQSGDVPPIEALEKKSDLAEIDVGEYRDSWAWIHFMLHGPPEARAELAAFLGDKLARRADGPRGADPLSTRLRRRLPDLDRRFIEHFKNWHEAPTREQEQRPRQAAAYR